MPDQTVEWGIRLHWDHGQTEDCSRDSEADARRSLAMHLDNIANRPGWRVIRAELVRRVHTVSPWRPADHQQAQCTCPDIDATTISQQPGSHTIKGHDPDCPRHGQEAGR